jgi:hypothetical protein
MQRLHALVNSMAYAKDPITPQVHMDVLPALLQHTPRYKDSICCDFCGGDNPIYVYHATRFSTGEPVPAGGVALRWAACKLCSAAVDRDDWDEILRRMRPNLRVMYGQQLGGRILKSMSLPPERVIRDAVQKAVNNFKEAAIPV